jgi:hypothetical protein
MTTPRLPRDEARAWIRRALTTAFPFNHARDLEEYGDDLFSIAEDVGVPDDVVVWWIHEKHPSKDCSLEGWRAWCRRWASDARRAPEAAALRPEPPESSEPAVLCGRCLARLLRQLEGRYLCSRCDDVTVVMQLTSAGGRT